VSEVIATLLLIAIAVIAAVLLYAFATGFFTSFSKGGSSLLVTATGELIVPGSSDTSGVLVLTVTDDGSQPVQGVSVSCPNPPFMPPNCGALLPLALQFNGVAVSPLHPLPVNGVATVSASVSASVASSFASGTTYEVAMTVTFVGGSTQILAVSVPATS
jgi:hypothetical protein